MQVQLRELAFSRSGDKGDVCNVGVMAKTPQLYPLLCEVLTPERIRACYDGVVQGDIEVYPVPNLHSLNIVLRRALGGGATTTLRFDQTGKAMCTALLRITVDADEALVNEARRVAQPQAAADEATP